MHDYIAVCPAQFFVHLSSCVIRNLASSMTFDAPPKPANSIRDGYNKINMVKEYVFMGIVNFQGILIT